MPVGIFFESDTQALFDNVRLSVGGGTPEPATMALLAVGGLVTLIRRRRK
jgi:hypothetical protein